MNQPDGFIANGQEGKVCKLLKFTGMVGIKELSCAYILMTF
jgi:hypothetical protein